MKKPNTGDPRRNYAKEWKDFRAKTGWSQKKMALVLRVCRKTVFNVESGNHRPSLASRKKMQELKKKHIEAKSWNQ